MSCHCGGKQSIHISVLDGTVGNQSVICCFSTTLSGMFQISQQSHYSWLQHSWADVAFFTVFIEILQSSLHGVSSSAPQQDCIPFPACLCTVYWTSLVFFCLLLLHNGLLLLLFFAVLCLCAAVQQSSYYRPQLSRHAHAKPTLAQALATTGPLSGLPAQVARRLYVAQSTPWPHTSASSGGGGRMESCISEPFCHFGLWEKMPAKL